MLPEKPTRTKVYILVIRHAIYLIFPSLNLHDVTYFKVMSPLSIISAMYMLAAGSKGATQSEILNKESFLTINSRKRPRKVIVMQVGFQFICLERPVW